ncbi:MAG: class I SAM-dependent methyltransferase [Polyangiaceae bacterium]
MKHVGDCARARERYFQRATPNLAYVVKHRYAWMNDFIEPGWTGVELGAGSGLSREIIDKGKLLVTDFAEYDWLDVKNVDALKTPFEDGAFDFVVESNMIHHVAHPLAFLEEARRILRPGGRLFIQDVNGSLLMRAVLRLQRHEGFDYNVDVFDERVPCNDPSDPWSANNAVLDLLFEDRAKFAQKVPYFRIVHESYSEFLTLLNSGGVIAEAPHVPLPRFLVEAMGKVDRVLTNAFPRLLALQIQLVLEKTA